MGQVRPPRRAAPRIRLTSVSERSSGVDERLAAIFRDMRRALRLTKQELARKLETEQSVIDAMELGRVQALPPWPETVRIISEFGQLNRVDVRPILARIRDQVGPAGLGQIPASTPAARRSPSSGDARSVRAQSAHGPSVRVTTGDEAREKRKLRSRRRADRAAKALSVLTAPVVLVAGLLWIAQAQSAAMVGGLGLLPEPLARLARPVIDYLILRLAPERDGLHWIEVGDPRSRKSDKLRQVVR